MSFYKFSEYNMENLDDIINNLEPNVQKVINEKINEYKYNLLYYLVDSESPIERLLLIQLKDKLEENNYWLSRNDILINSIDNQYEIQCGDKNYRVDILITYENQLTGKTNERGCKAIIIECDGHEFHEKTKEQVKKDNERDRNLTKAGYTVVHFSGSEIVEDAYRCACEIVEMMVNSFK